MTTCHICGEGPPCKRLLCGACASYMVLGNRISLINSTTEVETLTADINGLIGPNLKYEPKVALRYGSDKPSETRWTGALQARTENLARKLHKIEQNKLKLSHSIQETRQTVARLKSANAETISHIREQRKRARQVHDAQKREIHSVVSSNVKDAELLKDSIDRLAWAHCKDLALLFGIRKRRRKKEPVKESAANGGRLHENYRDDLDEQTGATNVSRNGASTRVSPYYDILIGFVVVPDLSILSHYPPSTIGSSLERVAYFCCLVAYYLDVRLPFDIFLPQRSQPTVRMAHAGLNIKQSIHLNETIKSIAEQKPKLFEHYVGGLAMLALDMAHVARALGISISSCEEIAQLNKVVASVYRSLVPSEKRKRDEQRTSAVNSAMADLASLQDYIITQTYLDLNGESAEWNLVDLEETEEKTSETDE